MNFEKKSVGCVCDCCHAVDYSACPEFEKGLMVGAYIATMINHAINPKQLIGLCEKRHSQQGTKRLNAQIARRWRRLNRLA